MKPLVPRLAPPAVALAVAGLALSGCSRSGAAPPHRLAALPPAATPSATASASTPPRRIDQKSAEAAVVRAYFRAVNRLPVSMDAVAIETLTTPSCPCRKLVRSVRNEAARHRSFYGTNAINAVRVNADGPDLGDVLVDFDATAAGIRSTNGMIVTRAKPRRHVNLDFTVVDRSGRWLIERIDEV